MVIPYCKPFYKTVRASQNLIYNATGGNYRVVALFVAAAMYICSFFLLLVFPVFPVPAADTGKPIPCAQLDTDCAVYGNSQCYRSGSTKPATLGLWNITLYSMRFCPYSERARLILNSKLIKYNIINIDPYKQPDWFAAINPKKQVPSLELENGTRIHGSLDIAVYVNENLPGKRYQHDPEKDYIVTFVTENIAKAMKILNNRTIPFNESLLIHFMDSISKLNGILTGMQTTYFSGNSAGMTDMMIWPWFERLIATSRRPKVSTKMSRYQVEALAIWKRKMSNNPVISRTKYSDDAHEKYYESHDCDAGLCDCRE